MNEDSQTPKSFGQILDRTFRLSRRYFKEFFLIILILIGPVYLLDALFQLGSGVGFFREISEGGNYAEQLLNTIEETENTGLFSDFLQLVLQLVMSSIALAAILIGVKHINQQAQFTPAGLIKQAFSRFWPIVGSSFVVSLMFFGIIFIPVFVVIMMGVIGTNAAPVPSIIFAFTLLVGVFLGVMLLGVRWGFFLGPVVFEKDFPGLSRSWHLSKGQTWKLVGIFVILFLITNVIQSVIDVILVAILGYSVLKFALTSVLAMLVNLILMIGYAVVFFDLKVRRDADDLNQMLSDYTEK